MVGWRGGGARWLFGAVGDIGAIGGDGPVLISLDGGVVEVALRSELDFEVLFGILKVEVGRMDGRLQWCGFREGLELAFLA